MSDNIFARVASSEIGQRIGLTETTAKFGLIGGASVLVLAGIYPVVSANQVSCSSSGAQDAVVQVAKDNRSTKLYAWTREILNSSSGNLTCSASPNCAAAESAYNSTFQKMQAIAERCEAIPAVDENDACPTFQQKSAIAVSDQANGWNPWGRELTPRETALNEARTSNVSDAATAAENYATMGLPPALYERIMKLPETTESGRRKYMNGVMDQLVEYNQKLENYNEALSDLSLQSSRDRQSNIENAFASADYILQDIVMIENNKDIERVGCSATIVASSGSLSPINWRIKYAISKTSDGELLAEVWGLN